MSHAATAAESIPRMSADVMEIDIAQVIAQLEAEQTLIIHRTHAAAARRRRGVVGSIQRLFRRFARSR